jgi:hypothetical protein
VGGVKKQKGRAKEVKEVVKRWESVRKARRGGVGVCRGGLVQESVQVLLHHLSRRFLCQSIMHRVRSIEEEEVVRRYEEV